MRNFLSSLAYIRVSSMLLFCRYFVVYSAIPQVIKVNCIDCICIQMCFDVFMYLRDDFSRFLHFLFLNKLCDPVSVYVMLYVIILIQILIRYNVKNLITACTRSLDFDLKIEKSPPSQTLPPLGRFAPSGSVAPLLRICHFSTRCPPPPPQCVDPRYATGPWCHLAG